MMYYIIVTEYNKRKHEDESTSIYASDNEFSAKRKFDNMRLTKNKTMIELYQQNEEDGDDVRLFHKVEWDGIEQTFEG